ncbi:unnamed protein product [Symbiodinium sp. CCMP2592]|nr:unnamed protein product [Symbiodinium sp. CCMP2592]
MSAEQAAHAFKMLKTTSRGGRQHRFNDKMQSYAEGLTNFVKAIDEYLFFLGKNKFFPANYPLNRVLPPQRYAELEKKWRAAEKEIGMLEA